MKLIHLAAAFAAAALVAAPASSLAGTICPSAGSATSTAAQTGCNSILTFNSNGTTSVTAGSAATPYDGSDDNLVGVVNNSGATVFSIVLTGSGNGGGLFAFDGDGIDGYVPASATSGNTHDNTGYGGPISYFTNVNAAQTTGTVNFVGGLAAGATTYFSLESDFTTTSGITPGSPTPEPSTLMLLGTGALGVAGAVRRRIFNK